MKVPQTLAQTWTDTQNWEQFQNIRLERIKQQRHRMENMKQVVSQYSRIIQELEERNQILKRENQGLRKNRGVFSQFGVQIGNQNAILSQKCQQLVEELQNQRRKRQACEISIQKLHEEIEKFNVQRVLRDNEYLNEINLQSDYEVLQGLYEELKNQVYSLHKQNLSLKEAIRDQSRFCYQKQGFWKENGKENRPGLIKNTSRTTQQIKNTQSSQTNQFVNSNNPQNISQVKLSTTQISSPSMFIISKSNISQPPYYSPTHKNSQYKAQSAIDTQDPNAKVRSLKSQIKKLQNLLQKFKANESQQLQLIQLLKSQKSKVCLCHSHGKCSSKSFASKGDTKIHSFKQKQ